MAEPYWCPWCRKYKRAIVCDVCGRECDLTSGPTTDTPASTDEQATSWKLPGQEA